MGKKDVLTDVRDLILKKLKEIERNLNWLSRKTDISYGTLYSCFIQKTFQLSQENLDKINNTLQTDFTL